MLTNGTTSINPLCLLIVVHVELDGGLAGVAIDEAAITDPEDAAATEDTPHQSYASTRVSIQ